MDGIQYIIKPLSIPLSHRHSHNRHFIYSNFFLSAEIRSSYIQDFNKSKGQLADSGKKS